MVLQIFNSFGCFDINHWMFWVEIQNQFRKSKNYEMIQDFKKVGYKILGPILLRKFEYYFWISSEMIFSVHSRSPEL